MLREIKEKMVTSEVLGRFVRDQKPISYYWGIMVSIESSVDMILHWNETDAIAEALWHLFGDELTDIYRLVNMDRNDGEIPVPENLKRCFTEAKELLPVGVR